MKLSCNSSCMPAAATACTMTRILRVVVCVRVRVRVLCVCVWCVCLYYHNVYFGSYIILVPMHVFVGVYNFIVHFCCDETDCNAVHEYRGSEFVLKINECTVIISDVHLCHIRIYIIS
jgi:hypothetical protein